ncbi:DUF2553 family protein [Metabacillus iocasae]|uniref:DUF2553 family protein n=1 Tax=Priestia iocasae TaxID=2291674 RepID=A0ABS2R045_9BACI|nr:DUF2553 family protein [Metabacillus iocasae]MBM7704858.1 hypothetical protein [Metabacillus iocasae]
MSMFHIMDVTERVYAKIREDCVELYFHTECIGKVILSEEGKEYDLHEGYAYEDNKILKLINCEENVPPYVEDCDLGWC